MLNEANSAQSSKKPTHGKKWYRQLVVQLSCWVSRVSWQQVLDVLRGFIITEKQKSSDQEQLWRTHISLFDHFRKLLKLLVPSPFIFDLGAYDKVQGKLRIPLQSYVHLALNHVDMPKDVSYRVLYHKKSREHEPKVFALWQSYTAMTNSIYPLIKSIEWSVSSYLLYVSLKYTILRSNQ